MKSKSIFRPSHAIFMLVTNLFAVWVLSIGNVSAQQQNGEPINLLEETVNFNGKFKTALSGYVQVEPKVLTEAWIKHCEKNLKFSLQNTNDIYQIREVKLSPIINKTGDFSTLVEPSGKGGSKLSTAVSLGYDTHLNSRDFPNELQNLRNFIQDFVAKFYVDYYTRMNEKAQLAYRVALSDLKNAETASSTLASTEQVTKAAAENAQNQIKILSDKNEDKMALIQAKETEIGLVKKDISKLFKNQKTYNIQGVFKFKPDLISYKGNVKNGYTGYIDIKPDEILAIWQDYLKSNIDIELNKDAPYFEAFKVDLPGITDKSADLLTQISEYGGGTKMSVIVSVGYDISLNSRDYPFEFYNFRNFMKGFADIFNEARKNETPGINNNKFDQLVANIIDNQKEIELLENEVKQNNMDKRVSEELIVILKKSNDNSRKIIGNFSADDIEQKKRTVVELNKNLGYYQENIERNQNFVANPALYQNTNTNNTNNNKSNPNNDANTIQNNGNVVANRTNINQTTSKPNANSNSNLDQKNSKTNRDALDLTKTDQKTDQIDKSKQAELAANASGQNTRTETKSNTQTRIIASKQTLQTTKDTDQNPNTKPQNTTNKYYAVQKGDTLYSIARQFKIDVSKLIQANKLNGNSIQVGETLNIPSF